MDISRLRTGELIAGIAGLALLIIMFAFDWFGVSVGGELDEAIGIAVPEVDIGANAWDSMEVIRWLLLITGLVAVGLAVMTALAQTPSLPVAGSALVAGLGILSTIFVLYRLINPPGDDVGREIGVWLGLIASAAIAYGGWRSMQEEGTTFGEQADRLQARGGDGGAGGEGPPPPPPPPGGSAA